MPDSRLDRTTFLSQDIVTDQISLLLNVYGFSVLSSAWPIPVTDPKEWQSSVTALKVWQPNSVDPQLSIVHRAMLPAAFQCLGQEHGMQSPEKARASQVASPTSCLRPSSSLSLSRSNGEPKDIGNVPQMVDWTDNQHNKMHSPNTEKLVHLLTPCCLQNFSPICTHSSKAGMGILAL